MPEMDLVESGSLVRVERRGLAVWLTIDRPRSANALSREVLRVLRAALEGVDKDAPPVALVITGAGRTFCAGADLRERLGMSHADTLAFLDEFAGLLADIEAFPRPVIAAIGGAAQGGGMELALACDLRICAADTTLGLPEVRLGIIPGAGGTQRLSRMVGLGVAKDLVLTGRRLDGAAAAALGLVSRVVPRDALESTVDQVVAELAAAGPLALAQAKRAIDAGWGMPLREGLSIERAAYEVTLGSADRDEGLQAFAQKRRPQFRGK